VHVSTAPRQRVTRNQTHGDQERANQKAADDFSASIVREGACEMMLRRHKGPSLYRPKTAHAAPNRQRMSSDFRQAFRWTIQAGGVAANPRNQLRRRYLDCYGLDERDKSGGRQWPRHCMDRATLVLEIDDAVVMIGVGLACIAGQMSVIVAGYRCRLIDVKPVVVH
jgi:hypothetical protein